MIPDAKQAAVDRALQTTFGTSHLDEIRPLTGGLSPALVYRIVVRGVPYVLRLMKRTDAVPNPTHQFTCMKAAAEAGVAPRMHYADVDDWVLISDFVEPQPFPENFAAPIAIALRTLHALPPFRAPLIGSYLDAADRFVRQFQAARILPEARTDDVLRSFAEILKVYPRTGADQVASHNDLKPDNIVFDGTRAWLIDWESAFLNDRYVDLAIVANFFATDDDRQMILLTTYFGEAPGDERWARFVIAQQMLHVVYAAFLLPLASRATSIDPDRTAPDFEEYHARLRARTIDLGSAEAKVDYGLVHLERARQHMHTSRFTRALAIVG